MKDEIEFQALRSLLAKHLHVRVEEVELDDILQSIYLWDRMTLEGITIGSRSSRSNKLAVSRENYFIRIRHENQQRNMQYTYRDTYAEILHYLEINLTGHPLLMVAYIQQYNTLSSHSLVEQRDPAGEPLYIHAATIRSLLGRFQCHGRIRNRLIRRTWFIDRDRMYKMMRALSGYHTGRIEVTDDSDNDDDREEDGIEGDD